MILKVQQKSYQLKNIWKYFNIYAAFHRFSDVDSQVLFDLYRQMFREVNYVKRIPSHLCRAVKIYQVGFISHSNIFFITNMLFMPRFWYFIFVHTVLHCTLRIVTRECSFSNYIVASLIQTNGDNYTIKIY